MRRIRGSGHALSRFLPALNKLAVHFDFSKYPPPLTQESWERIKPRTKQQLVDAASLVRDLYVHLNIGGEDWKSMCEAMGATPESVQRDILENCRITALVHSAYAAQKSYRVDLRWGPSLPVSCVFRFRCSCAQGNAEYAEAFTENALSEDRLISSDFTPSSNHYCKHVMAVVLAIKLACVKGDQLPHPRWNFSISWSYRNSIPALKSYLSFFDSISSLAQQLILHPKSKRTSDGGLPLWPNHKIEPFTQEPVVKPARGRPRKQAAAVTARQTSDCTCKEVGDAESMIGCDGPCGKWYHFDCVNMSNDEFTALATDGTSSWVCPNCKADTESAAMSSSGSSGKRGRKRARTEASSEGISFGPDLSTTTLEALCRAFASQSHHHHILMKTLNVASKAMPM